MNNLEDSIAVFIKELCSKYFEIKEIWWIGSRANDMNVRPDSDWDFLAFAEESTHSQIRVNRNLAKKAIELNIDLLVENRPGVFSSVWGPSKTLELKTDLKWENISSMKAKYWASKLEENAPIEPLFQGDWQKYAVEHGADIWSDDVSAWMYAIKVWPQPYNDYFSNT